jgi:hypothetical protein
MCYPQIAALLTIYLYIKRVFFYSFGRADYVAVMRTNH